MLELILNPEFQKTKELLKKYIKDLNIETNLIAKVLDQTDKLESILRVTDKEKTIFYIKRILYSVKIKFFEEFNIADNIVDENFKDFIEAKFLTQLNVQNFIIPYIKFQYVFLSSVINMFKPNENSYNVSKIRAVTSLPIIPHIENFIIPNFINNLILTSVKKKSNKELNKNLDKDDLVKIEKYKKIIMEIFKYYLKKDRKDCVTYGSFSLNLIDSSIIFNDIDIYHEKAFQFLINIQLFFHLILNEELEVFHIPYVNGHMALRYKREHLADCLFFNTEILKKIPFFYVQNVPIVEPMFQFLLNFKMFIESERIYDMSQNLENTIKKVNTTFDYTISKLGINLETFEFLNDKSELPFKIQDNSCIFDIDDTNYIYKYIVLFCSREKFIDITKNLRGMYSYKFGILIDEHFFECNTQDNENIDSTNNDALNYVLNLFKELKNKKIILATCSKVTKYIEEDKGQIINISLKNIRGMISQLGIYSKFHKRESLYKYCIVLLIMSLTLKENENIVYKTAEREKTRGKDHISINFKLMRFKSIRTDNIKNDKLFFSFKEYKKNFLN